ncbi:hypothetical protein [Pseudomonas arcuscaelestis]|uniref:hypothetical protein n=1 Tax=Pseudomonas arcuscaelestis TaxID=2710591 RepID=UPI00193E170F|nr:hypothetical protein [Pseudomonas arcuscaelestis]MBM3113025.1 hypothetical protein [Pseudomonas arcuscaelestis]
MKFQRAFDRMRKIVEADDCLLTGYEVDFYKFDLLHLTVTACKRKRPDLQSIRFSTGINCD